MGSFYKAHLKNAAQVMRRSYAAPGGLIAGIRQCKGMGRNSASSLGQQKRQQCGRQRIFGREEGGFVTNLIWTDGKLWRRDLGGKQETSMVCCKLSLQKLQSV